MSDTPAASTEAQAKKKKPLLFIIIAVVVLAVGGGGAFFFLKKGQAAEGETAGKEKEKSAKDKKKKGDEEEGGEEGEDGEAAEEHAEGEKGKAGAASKSKFSIKRLNLPDDKEVKKVIELQPFVVNLADKGQAHYLRMTVSLGLGETKEEKPDPLLVTRVRNALLAVLTTKTAEEVLSEPGKAVLRKELLKAARAAVEEPPIEAIYITDFIVQM